MWSSRQVTTRYKTSMMGWRQFGAGVFGNTLVPMEPYALRARTTPPVTSRPALREYTKVGNTSKPSTGRPSGEAGLGFTSTRQGKRFAPPGATKTGIERAQSDTRDTRGQSSERVVAVTITDKHGP